MAGTKRDTVAHYVRHLVAQAAYREWTDSQLLHRFAAQHDEAAFAALVHRHGRMVWSVCRNLLRHIQDAEDTFQATFTVLACNPAKVGKPEALGSWLHGVALRFALKARRDMARRREHEQAAALPPGDETSELSWREVRQVLDEEVQRLPEKYRLPFVLCILEEKSLAEAARQLGWKEGTVSGRLTVARQRLRGRLVRRGIELPAVIGVLTVAGATVEGSVPLGLTRATIRSAVSCVAHPGAAAPFVSPGVNNLIQGVKSAMYPRATKLKVVSLLSLILAAGAGGAFTVSRAGGQGDPPAPAAIDRKSAAPARPAAKEGDYGGTVSDAMTGKPVGGIKVVVRRLVKGKPAGQTKITSDAAGRFRFDLPADWAEPADAKVAVGVEAPPGYLGFPYRKLLGWSTEGGVALAELRRDKTLGLPPYFDRLLLFPTKAIKGRVLDPDGKPFAKMDVVVCSVHLKDQASPSHRLVRRTKTDAKGRFEAAVLSPGPVVLYLMPERYAARYVKLNDPAGDLGDYKLEAGVEVAGKLRDAKNRPLPGRWVRVGTPTGPDEDRDLRIVGIGGFARWCRTGPDGTFRTAPLPPGDYQASAHGVQRRARAVENFPGSDPSWDDLAGRERVGEPLEVCIVPQPVSVRAGKAPQVVLRAVPHVNLDIKVADRDGKPREAAFYFRYTFDGKEYWAYNGHLESPTTRDGRLVIRVPHGTSGLQGFPVARDAICLPQKPKRAKDNPAKDGLFISGSNVFFKDLDADKSLNVLWIREADASLKVSAKDGSPLKDVDIDARHSNELPIGPASWGGGMYQLWHVQPDRPFTIRVKVEGYEPVTKTTTVPAGQPKRIEIVLEKKK